MIGFKLPQGARTVHGHQMDLDAHPWGPDGNLPTPSPHDKPFPNAWSAFHELHAKRYGRPVSPDDPSVVSFPGLEHPQYQSWIEIIAERNPGFWEQQGLGEATGDKTASTEEVFDAQAWEGRKLIEEEGRRLFLLDRLPPVRGEEEGPRLPPLVPTPPPPLSPLSVRVEEVRQMAFDAAAWLESKALKTSIYVATGFVAWPLFRPFIVEALHFYRLLRRHLGDTRPLPGRE